MRRNHHHFLFTHQTHLPTCLQITRAICQFSHFICVIIPCGSCFCLHYFFFCLYYNFKSTTPQIQYSEEKWIFYYVLTFGNQITKRKIKLTISISKSDWFSLRLRKADQDEQCITSLCCKMLTLWCSEILSIR